MKFIINLPFKYKTAVLTQARTSKYRPFAFIVEFQDGSRKFMKGPFKNREPAEDHVRCNEIKRKLESKYLHPIQCEVKEYGPQAIFLVCDELGKADLDKVKQKKTDLDGIFEVLSYALNDVVPDPLSLLPDIKKKNQHIWIALMVNYCFRWVFGIGDTAARNLMLEKSSGKIYSTDEIFLKDTERQDFWRDKKPAKKKFDLIRAFAQSGLFDEVLKEVENWKKSLNSIRREFGPIPEEVERRIDQFLNDPGTVLEL